MSSRNILRFELDGKVTDLDREALTIALIKECRAATGKPPMAIAAMFAAGDGDLDTLAAMYWLALRQNGEKVTLAQVEEGLSYASGLTSTLITEGVGENNPEV